MAQLVIPGYRFDPTVGRYFKEVPGSRAIPSSLPPATKEPEQTGSKRKGKRSSWEESRSKTQKVLRAEGGQPSSSVLQNWRLVGGRQAAEERTHAIDGLAMARLQTGITLYPDCLPVDDSVCAIDLDDTDPSIIRVGGSGGCIATGNLDREAADEAYYPNDEMGWRLSWMFPAPITSLVSCQTRILATCLGPPAQALVGTFINSVSLASVTLAPRKTSLWTSAMSPSLIALGCDSKVLLSKDPTRAATESYTTGSKHGAAVFALDLTDNLVFAGTRSATVKVFDQRSSPTSNEEAGGKGGATRSELTLHVSSACTNVKRTDQGLLVACMDGSLSVYDLRFPRPIPVLSLAGHSNSYTTGLGLDVWQDSYVAAAGDDARVRLWSLRSGKLLSPLEAQASKTEGLLVREPPSPWARKFSEPVKALRFADSYGARFARRDDGARYTRKYIERTDRVAGYREGPNLWIGDGPKVECFSLGVGAVADK